MTPEKNEALSQELALLTDATRRICTLHGTLGLAYPKTDILSRCPTKPADSWPPPEKLVIATKGQAASEKPPAPPVASAQDIVDLKDTISHCERCVAEDKRLTTLYGKGRQDRPSLLIIGDVASREGIAQNEIFPGQEGELLVKMLAAINIGVQDVFQTNIIKCALESEKVPLPTQLQNCRPHLLAQITLLRPLIICTMGQIASQCLLGTKNKLIALRGRFHQFDGVPLMATYHPSQLLQVPDLKKAAWYDLQLIQHKLSKIQQS